MKRYTSRMMICLLLAGLAITSPVTVLAQTKSQMLEVMQQLTRLEREVRQLRGEVERLAHENKRLKNQQNDLYIDLDARMGKLEQQPANSAQATQPALVTTTVPAVNSATAVSSSSAASSTTTPPLAEQPATGVSQQAGSTTNTLAAADPKMEQTDYKSAFNLLKVGKYEEAIAVYTEFLKLYPQGKYAGNAQYWLGEAYYVTRQFPQALLEFKKVLANHPDSRKLPDAMLKIGYIHYELKESEQARQVLSDLKQNYPGTTPARLADNRLQRMKLEGR